MSLLTEHFWSRMVYVVAFGAVALALLYAARTEREQADPAAETQAAQTASPATASGSAGSAPGNGASPAAASTGTRANGERDESGAEVALQRAAGSPASETDGYLVPIPIPPELAEIFERDDNLRTFHEQLEREPEDPAWSAMVESELADFLADTFDLSEFIVQLLECRSTSCEVLVTGYGDEAFRTWINGVGAGLFESGKAEEWIDGPMAGSCGGSDMAPGVFALHCVFSQTEQQENDPATDVTFSLDAPYGDGVDFERVAVPEDLVQLIETKAEVYELHRALETEPTDFGWSEFIEAQIVEHFNANPELETLTVVGVECRTTLCEVQLTMSDPSMFGNWLDAMMDFQRESWHDLGTADMNGLEIGEDLMGIVWLLERRTGD